MINSYDEALQFINNTGSEGIVPGLDRIRMLLRLLGDPQKKLRVIHVAGTNGKGSVCTYISSVLMESGYSVGRYISPVIEGYRERIQISGVWISEEDFTAQVRKIFKAVSEMKMLGMDPPSTFEAETAAAFLYFAEKDCDYTVLETGMGGLEDATNIIESPVVSVITRVAMDHMRFLGDTLEKIAVNKAGIIKEGRPVVYFDYDPVVSDVILKRASYLGSQAFEVKADDVHLVSAEIDDGMLFEIDGKGIFRTSLLGTYQMQNAEIAIRVCDVLCDPDLPGFPDRISRDTIRSGIEKAIWPGRFEVLGRKPLLIVDGGHNPDGAAALKNSLLQYAPDRRIIFVMGVFADKKYSEMLDIRADSHYVLLAFTPVNKRGLDCEVLKDKAITAGFAEAHAFSSQEEALDYAFSICQDDDVIMHFGSLSTIEGLKKYLETH